MLNLDTHILLFALDGRLTHAERRVLERHAKWGISAIVLWEVEKLRQRRRIPRGLDDPDFARQLSHLTIWPVSVAVCLQLRSLDFSSNPADELIAATSIAFDVPLVTRDARIRSSKVVPLA